MKLWIFLLFVSDLAFGQSSGVTARRHSGDWWVQHGLKTMSPELALKLDPKKNGDWTETLEGGYRTAYGTQFNKDCMSQVRASSLNEKASFRRIEFMIQEAFSRMYRCRKNYPELNVYFEDWITSARRHVIGCVEGTASDYDAGAWNNLGKKTTFPKDTFVNFAITGAASISTTGEKRLYANEGHLSTLMHEVLHGTSVNNRSDHNQIQRIPPDKENFCAEDSISDRVSFVESLCSGYRMNSAEENILPLLEKKIRQCGIQSACIDLFSGKKTNLGFFSRLFTPSKDLPVVEAEKLCLRIQDDLYCSRTRKEYGLARYGQLPIVLSLKKKLRKQLKNYLPSLNHVPGGLLEMYPEIKTQFVQLSKTGCFRGVLLFEKNGDLVVHKEEKKNLLFEDVFQFHQSFAVSTVSGTIESGLLGHVEEHVGRTPDCQSGGSGKKLYEVTKNLVDQVRHNEDIYGVSAVSATAAGIHREGFLYDPPKGVRKMLGDSLLNEYLDVTRKYHPYSAHYDCVENGLSPFRNAEQVDRDLLFIRQWVHGGERRCYVPDEENFELQGD